MAKVNHATINAMFQSFNTLFNKGFETTETFWEKVAMLVPSSGAQENYGWLGNMPALRQWIGERAIKKLIKKSYSIENLDFEASVAILRKEIEDDAYGVYSPVFQTMGESAAQWPDKLIFELIVKGFTDKCYDDQPFFSKNHIIGTGNDRPKVSNMSNKPLSLESYKEARAAMMSFKNDELEPLGVVPNLLVVPPALEDKGKAIVESEFIAIDGVTQTNTYKGTAELLVVPRLAGHDTKWFLLDTRKAIKPLIFQSRKEPEFAAITDPNSEHVFKNNSFLYGVDARGNVGFSFWQLAFGSTGQ